MVDRLPFSSVLVMADWPDLDSRRHELPPRGSVLSVVGEPTAWLEQEFRITRVSDGVNYGRLWTVNPVLERVVGLLPPGAVLDLGCGQGRDAVWLAANGWRVTAVDHLASSIERGRALQQRYAPGSSIDWIQGDLAEFQSLDVDLLFMAFGPTSRLDPATGVARSVLLCGFSRAHREATGKPKDEGNLITPEMAGLWGAEYGEFSMADRQAAFIWRTLDEHFPTEILPRL